MTAQVAGPIRSQKILSLMPTYQCTAACRYCGTLSSPKVATSLSRKQILSAIEQASELGFGLVVFTGGEPTLAGDTLFEGIERVRDLGMLSRVVTNCHWATDQAQSDAFINGLAARGLNEVNFSTGDQHTKFVPLDNILFAVRSALRSAFHPCVMIEVVDGAKVTRAKIESHPYFKEIQQEWPGHHIRFTESPWMPLQPNRVSSYPDGVVTDRTNIAAREGCDSILDTLTVQADGNLGACCGLGMRLVPELNVGHLDRTPLGEAIEDGEQDLLKRWIRFEGPEKILAWAAKKDNSIEWEGMYAHRCQACLRIYQDDRVGDVIREHYLEKMPDLLFSEWLLTTFENSDELAED